MFGGMMGRITNGFAGMMSGFRGMMGFGYGWMGLGMLLFGILVIAGLWLIFGAYRPHNLYVRSDSALEIARERYARGEITKEQFEEMKRVLGVEQASAPTAPSDTHPHR